MTIHLTRRDLLIAMGAALGTGVYARLLPSGIASASSIGPNLPTGTPVVVVIELTGANDILNMLVPMNVAGTTGPYRDARPTIGITRVTATRPFGPPPANDYLPPGLDLDGRWALHGALPWLANRWHDRGDVAIVQGTGENVRREMSHFAAMAYRWAGAFTGPLMATGWLGRYNDLANSGQPLGAISLSGLHQSLSAVQSPAVALSDLATFGFTWQNMPDAQRFGTDFAAMGDAASTAPNKVATAAKAISDANTAVTTAKGVSKLTSGGGQLGAVLTTAASLIGAGIPCQTYVATVTGFDTHGGEPYNQWDRLTELNAGLAHFFSLIDATPRAPDVFVVITSEFGRQVTQNAGQGTDHGLGSSTFVVGGGVKGGFYGQAPDLSPGARFFDALVPTVDFRSVYATVLDRLGNDRGITDTALGRDESDVAFENLGFFGSAPVPSSAGRGGAATATRGARRLSLTS
jgi:uncharacterized protein (DUF1501 family)